MWIPAAIAGAVSLGAADVLIESDVESGSNAHEALAAGLRLLVVAGAVSVLSLYLVDMRVIPTKKEIYAGVLLALGWVASVFCISQAGVTTRAVIHCSVVVAILISAYLGAKINASIMLSILALIIATTTTVWSFTNANP